jgi:hypothetical protein
MRYIEEDMTDLDAAITTAEQTTDTPTIKVTFHDKDSAAFEVVYAGISPAMFAAFASWCSYMSTKGYAERDYAEAVKAQAMSKIVPATVMPGGRH